MLNVSVLYPSHPHSGLYPEFFLFSFFSSTYLSFAFLGPPQLFQVWTLSRNRNSGNLQTALDTFALITWALMIAVVRPVRDLIAELWQHHHRSWGPEECPVRLSIILWLLVISLRKNHNKCLIIWFRKEGWNKCSDCTLLIVSVLSYPQVSHIEEMEIYDMLAFPWKERLRFLSNLINKEVLEKL